MDDLGVKTIFFRTVSFRNSTATKRDQGNYRNWESLCSRTSSSIACVAYDDDDVDDVDDAGDGDDQKIDSGTRKRRESYIVSIRATPHVSTLQTEYLCKFINSFRQWKQLKRMEEEDFVRA